MSTAKSSILWLALVLLPVLAGCDQLTDIRQSDEGQTRAAVGQAARVVAIASASGIEREFMELEAKLPGFGGFYIDATGDIVAYVSDPSSLQAREAFVDHFLGSVEARERLAREDGSPRDVALVVGEYAFTDLAAWKVGLREALLVSHGVKYLDADERWNRVTVGVYDAGTTESVMALSDRLGIPEGALNIEVSPSVALAAKALTATWRPVKAGVTVGPSFTGSPDCSVGFNFTRNGSRYFLTASHCVGNFGGGGIGLDFYQNNNSITNKIGDVSENPAWSGTGCIAGADYCAYADVATVEYVASVSSEKKVLQSSSVGSGNSAGNLDVNKEFTIGSQSNSLPVGTKVWRTGQTSGTTKGNILASCVSILYQHLTTFLESECTDKVDARGKKGDSGGPVYRWHAPLISTSRSALGVMMATDIEGSNQVYFFNNLAAVQNRLGTMYLF